MMEIGQPRSRLSSERLGEVYEVVRDLLLEVGYDRLTMDAVAARARSSKTTLYRQWNGKTGLIIAALQQGQGSTASDYLDAGSLDEVFEALAAQAADPPGRDLRLAFTLVNAAANDAEFGATLRSVILEPQAQRWTSVFEQAAERGEILREPALFRRLSYMIICHMAFFPVLSGEPRSVESRRALLTSMIRPALTFLPRADT